MMKAMQVTKVTRRMMIRASLIVVGLGFALAMTAPAVNALQDPQNGGPRMNAPQQAGYPQNAPQQNAPQQNAPQQNAPQQSSPQSGPQQNEPQSEPQDDGVPDNQAGYPPQQGGQQSGNPQANEPQQPSYSQNGGPQGGGPQGSGPQGGGAPGGGPSQRGGPQFPSAQSEVARISLLHGEISMQRADLGDWSTATLNTPLVRGDQVATGDKSRAEIQLDYADILRLSSHSQAKIADLTRTRIQLQIAQGYANFSMFKGGEAEVEIDTPNVSVHPRKNGRYRIQVNSDSETDVIVREGEAEVTTPQGSTTVKKGQQITVRGTTNPEYRVDGAPQKDDWDRFNNDRDGEIRNAASWGRTNPYYTGSGDLDAHGRWVFVPGYGWVWQPYQQANWAPYQSGRWVYEPYWGWTWVSYESWGWAPYHYGRWFVSGGSWVWWPGPVYARYRPIWSPAYVSFIGFGGGVGVGVGFGFGSIGWIPCGPFDSFYPWYGRGFNRVTVVNITNINIRNGGGFAPLGVRGRQPFVSNVNLALTNERVRSGISGVPAGEFGRNNVQVRALNVREADLRESRVVTGNVPVVPTRESLRVGSESRIGQGGVQPRTNDRFFTRNQPPAAGPAFHEQASQVQQVMQGRAVNSQEHGGTVSGPGGNSSPQASQTQSSSSQGREASAGSRGLGANSERSTAPASSGPAASRQTTSGSPQNSGVANNGSNERSAGGWTKFGAGSGRGNDSVRSGSAPSGPSGPSGPASRSGSSVPSSRSGSASGATTTGPSGPTGQSVDRNNSGWQRFPSNSNSGPNSGPSSNPSSVSTGKPSLELNKPIVTPRDTPASSPTRSGPPSSSPRGSETRGSSPSGGSRERSTGGSHERGGGDKGDKGSKSNSGSKNR